MFSFFSIAINGFVRIPNVRRYDLWLSDAQFAGRRSLLGDEDSLLVRDLHQLRSSVLRADYLSLAGIQGQVLSQHRFLSFLASLKISRLYSSASCSKRALLSLCTGRFNGRDGDSYSGSGRHHLFSRSTCFVHARFNPSASDRQRHFTKQPAAAEMAAGSCSS
jgi:hypothetical protein